MHSEWKLRECKRMSDCFCPRPTRASASGASVGRAVEAPRSLPRSKRQADGIQGDSSMVDIRSVTTARLDRKLVAGRDECLGTDDGEASCQRGQTRRTTHERSLPRSRAASRTRCAELVCHAGVEGRWTSRSRRRVRTPALASRIRPNRCRLTDPRNDRIRRAEDRSPGSPSANGTCFISGHTRFLLMRAFRPMAQSFDAPAAAGHWPFAIAGLRLAGASCRGRDRTPTFTQRRQTVRDSLADLRSRTVRSIKMTSILSTPGNVSETAFQCSARAEGRSDNETRLPSTVQRRLVE